jgi:poly(3-hydroxyalkanoate) synthetase
MRYVVTSDRMSWPRGTQIDAADLSGNIDVLVQVGHLAPVVNEPKGKKAKLEPVLPDPVDDDSAEEPEEQE